MELGRVSLPQHSSKVMRAKTRALRKAPRARLRKKLDQALAQIEAAELVRRLAEDEPTYMFKHVLMQESAYALLLQKQRQATHRRVAEAYEEIYAERCQNEFAAILALHYAAAGDDAKTLEYATRAGDVAARVYAHDEALSHYALALDAAKRRGATTEQFIHLYTQRGRVLEVTGKFSQALTGYEEMASLAQTRGDRALELASLMLRATARSAPTPTFDANLAQQLLDDALGLARTQGDRAAEARVLWNLLLLNTHTSHPEQAIGYGEQALAIARELNERGHDMREQLAYILNDLFPPYFGGGQRTRGETIAAAARALWRELDNKPMLADNLGMTAQFWMMSGDFTRALKYAAEGAAIAESIGNWFGLFLNKSMQAITYTEMGELAHALRLGDQVMRLSETVGGLNQAIIIAQQAWLLGTLGAFEQALERDRRTRRALAQPMPGHFRAHAYATLARLHILQKNLAAAQADLAAGYSDHNQTLPLYAAAQIALAEAEMALARGDAARAVAVMDEQIAPARRIGARIFLPELLYLRGRALAQQGDVEAALESLREAHAEAGGMSARRVWWQILAALSEIETQRGNEVEAQSLRAQARETIEFIAEHTPTELRESFLNLPQVRAIIGDLFPSR